MNSKLRESDDQAWDAYLKIKYEDSKKLRESYESQRQEIERLYFGKYIAFKDGKIIAVSDDYLTIDDKYGYDSDILIDKVGETKLKSQLKISIKIQEKNINEY